MSSVIVTDIARADAATIDALAKHGVATVHEALGRVGLVGSTIRPVQDGTRVAGSAITVSTWPGDNLMIHAAIEQCRAGDMLVVSTTSPSTDGAFGELFATALQSRGVRGVVTTTGVRDVVDLRAMGFPVWSAAVNAQGTVKATAGSVNVPIVVGGVTVHAGDIVIADDDGVMVVPRTQAQAAVDASDLRLAKEVEDRKAYRGGELSLDRKGLRSVLTDLGVTWTTQKDYERSR